MNQIESHLSLPSRAIKIIMDRFDKLEGDLLFKGEILIITCESVGLYHENERMKMYDDGKLTLTNHRIIWKSSNGEPTLSLSLNLIEDFNLNARSK